jgi:orotate phosphoribosyltransferase
MTHSENVIRILKDIGAIITDSHFIYTSGMHGSVYIRKDRLYPHTDLTSKVCAMIAEDMKMKEIEVVVGPSVGGIILSQWTANHLAKKTGNEVLSVFTEKSYDDKEMFDRPQVFKRGYDALVAGKRVLVVEDLTTTGASVKKVVDRVMEAGGKVVCVYVLVNRNPRRRKRGFYEGAVSVTGGHKSRRVSCRGMSVVRQEGSSQYRSRTW